MGNLIRKRRLMTSGSTTTGGGGSGTVTSVGSGSGLTGGPITTTGSLSIDTSVVEVVANKSSDVNTDQASTTKYPSVKALFDWAVGLFTQKNIAITGDTKTKITYDSKGLVTSGADATTADIADSSNKRYVTDAQLTVIGNTSGTNTGDQTISDATISTTDITTNNVSITKHGFAPKAPNDATKYLDGTGAYSVPSVGASSTVTIANDTTTNAVMYPTWVTANTGSLPIKVSSTKLGWNPSLNSGTLLIGDTTVTPLGQFQITNSINGLVNLSVKNTNSVGTNATSSMMVFGDISRLDIVATGSSYSGGANPYLTANQSIIAAGSGSTSLYICTEGNADIFFGTNGNNNDRMRIFANGNIRLGSTLYPLTITSGYVPYATSANTIGSGAGLQFNGTELGIGTAPQVGRAIKITAAQAYVEQNSTTANMPAFTGYTVNSQTSYVGTEGSNPAVGLVTTGGIAGSLSLTTLSTNAIVFGTSATARWQITSAGEISGMSSAGVINGSTSSGGSLTIKSTSNATKGVINFGSSTGLQFDEVNTVVGIGIAANSAIALNISKALARVNMASTTTTNAVYTSLSVNSKAAYFGIENTSGTGFTTTGGLANAFMFNMSSANAMQFATTDSVRLTIIAGGQVGIGVTAPTAMLHLKAGTATANTAPLKFNSGTNLTTPEAGAVEFDGTNYFVTSSTTRYTLAKTLTATATLDFGSTAASSSTDLTITVTGAADGDDVIVTPPNGSIVANSFYTAWVSAANTVTVRFCNLDILNAADPASGTFRAVVFKY